MRKLAVLAASLGAMAAFADVTYYVSKTGDDAADGLSPQTALKHPQAAVLKATGEELTTILLASETYTDWTNAYKVIYTGSTQCDEYRVINITKGNIHIKPLDEKLGKPVLSAKTSGYSRVLQIATGLENVKVSGLKMIGGYTSSNQNGSPRTTSVLAYSGEIEDCQIIGNYRKRNSYVTLSGPVVLRRCELTESTSCGIDAGGGGGTLCPLTASVGALVDTCYVHDMKYYTGTKYWAACNGHGISVSGTKSIVRNTIVKNIKNGQTGATVGASGDGSQGAGMLVDGGALVENCTVVGCENLCNACGGIYVKGKGRVRNCVVWGNKSALDQKNTGDILLASDASADQVQYSDASTGVTSGENGNMASDPSFLSDGIQLGIDSPVAGKGLVDQGWMPMAKDWFGNPRLYEGSVSMGAMEPQGRAVTFRATPKIVGASFGPAPFSAAVDVELTGQSGDCRYLWNFGDGSPIVTSEVAQVTHAYGTVGHYVASLAVEDDNGLHDVDGTLLFDAVGDVCYVKANAAGEPPYDTWEKATSNIQAAVDFAPKTVLVSNGTYRISFEKDNYGLKLYGATRLVSVNGADKTFIQSASADPQDYLSRNLVRMTNSLASVEGFTFRRSVPPMIYATAGSFVGNVVSNAYTTYQDNFIVFGGIVGVTNCVFDGSVMPINWLNWGGSFLSLSGSASMDSCVIRNVKFGGNRWNDTLHAGVNVSGRATLRNSFMDGMTFENSYAGQPLSKKNWLVAVQDSGTVENCTITGVRAKGKLVGLAAGLYAGSNAKVRNVISSGNHLTTATVDADCDFVGSATVFENNLIGAGELPATAKGCIVGEDPCFADDGSGYRITKDSPCYNKGTPVSWASKKGKATDIDGQERHCGPIDIGCWELQRPLGLQVLVR